MGEGLSPEEARKFYDGFGTKQDAQRFYEDVATNDLLAKAGFEKAKRVFEYGCGTGRFARRLLTEYLPKEATYLGVDISPKMVEIAQGRIKGWPDRAAVRVAGEEPKLELSSGECDRFVSNYVFDLLRPEYLRVVVGEARRALAEDGKLCLVSLTYGEKPLRKAVAWVWERIYRLRPQLVGGCRPIRLRDYLPEAEWKIEYRNMVSAFGISSEIVIAGPIKQ
jgi:ubiquinone/menaquinone biosynthesis C-methylase UbiE